MGCVVTMNANLIGQTFPSQKHGLPSKKNNERQPIFSKKVPNFTKKRRKKHVTTHRKNTELSGLILRGKSGQTQFLVSESKLFSLKQMFVLPTQVFKDAF